MRSKNKLKILNQLAVTKPCEAEDFESISEPRGNGWFCHHCEKEVHDFSKLSKKEILKLVENSGGHFCASIQRRPDGSIVTKEPPSNSLLYSGVLLAGTSLFASSAMAESPPVLGEVVVDESAILEAPIRGDVAIPAATPGANCDADENMGKPPVQTSTPTQQQPPNSAATPSHQNTMETGRVAITPPSHTRGKVAIQKK